MSDNARKQTLMIHKPRLRLAALANRPGGISREKAIADAEESLRHGEPEARLLYSAARILALAAESAKAEPNRRVLSDAAAAESQRERALDLLRQAVERTPPQERAAFWSNVVQSDHAFTAIRRHSAYARIGVAAALPRSR